MMVFNRNLSQVFTSKCGPMAMSSSPRSSSGSLGVSGNYNLLFFSGSSTKGHNWMVARQDGGNERLVFSQPFSSDGKSCLDICSFFLSVICFLLSTKMCGKVYIVSFS